MSVCVGIDVHRKRSEVAVINEGGEVLASRNAYAERRVRIVRAEVTGRMLIAGPWHLRAVLEEYVAASILHRGHRRPGAVPGSSGAPHPCL